VCVCVCVCVCSHCSVMISDIEVTTEKFIYSRYTGIFALYIVSNYLLQILQRVW